MIEYPKYLPAPQLDGFGLNTADPTIRSEMQSGRARQRRRFTNVPESAQCSWLMTPLQASYFKAWHKSVLIDGAEWFSCRLRTQDAIDGTMDYDCRFVGMYSGPRWAPRNMWMFSATLELRERTMMPPQWLPFPEFWFNGNIIDMAMNREWPEA
ncbi:hypothetical protein D3C78_1170980 [compost metagenome]